MSSIISVDHFLGGAYVESLKVVAQRVWLARLKWVTPTGFPRHPFRSDSGTE